jgi:phage gpG-like protein
VATDATAGFGSLEARLDQLLRNADHAAKEAAEAMASIGERGIKIELSRSSHPPGTKTPAAPGSPPSLVTGRLRQSVRRTKLYHSGSGQWTAHVAPTTIYARIQELGGRAGPHHRSRLPPRPYVSPAQFRWALKARDAAVKVFRDVSGLP